MSPEAQAWMDALLAANVTTSLAQQNAVRRSAMKDLTTYCQHMNKQLQSLQSRMADEEARYVILESKVLTLEAYAPASPGIDSDGNVHCAREPYYEIPPGLPPFVLNVNSNDEEEEAH